MPWMLGSHFYLMESLYSGRGRLQLCHFFRQLSHGSPQYREHLSMVQGAAILELIMRRHRHCVWNDLFHLLGDESDLVPAVL